MAPLEKIQRSEIDMECRTLAWLIACTHLQHLNNAGDRSLFNAAFNDIAKAMSDAVLKHLPEAKQPCEA